MPGMVSCDCSRLKTRAGWSVHGPVARNFNLCDILLLKNAGCFILSLWQQREEKIELVCSTGNGGAAISRLDGFAGGHAAEGRRLRGFAGRLHAVPLGLLRLRASSVMRMLLEAHGTPVLGGGSLPLI